jgi:hypothetical protein
MRYHGLVGLLALTMSLGLLAASGRSADAWASEDDQQDREEQPYPQEQPYQDARGSRDDRYSPRPREYLPERYRIHKGKKCEVICDRKTGTRNFECREYRC